MSTATTLKPVSITLGTVLSLSLAAIPASQAADNPFSMEPLSTGYMMLAENKGGEGKCGEGKCGGKDKHGMSKMDADGDGKVSKDEFMKGHEAKFDQLDKNGDGVIDASERGAQHKGKGKCKHGKGSKDKSGADT